MQKLQLAKAGLTRGCICHWQQPFGNHFAVILNLAWPPGDDVVLFSIMTSNIRRFPDSVSNEIIRTGPKDYSFLSIDTVINLREVHAASLSAIVTQPQFSAKGMLTDAHLKRVNDILRASIIIEEEILDRIVLR
ncbi:MAG: hypothetical protein ACRD3J_29225 [Thermoanaerobaculia bacterium]